MLPPGAGGGAPAGGQQSGDEQCLLFDGEDQQGCFDLYRRAYGRHLDAAYPPLYVATVSLAFWSGLLPFWLALLLVPAGMVLGLHFILVKGEGRVKQSVGKFVLCRVHFAAACELHTPACRRLWCTLTVPSALPCPALSAPPSACRRRHPRPAAATLAPAGGAGGQPGSPDDISLLPAGLPPSASTAANAVLLLWQACHAC
jgi:hypothetical protein